MSARDPLRVTVFTGDFYPDQVGGQGIYAFEIATRVAALGHRVTVVCPSSTRKINYRYPERLNVRLVQSTSNPLSYLAALVPLQRELIGSADVLHVNELFGFTVSLLRPRKTALVISSHNAYLDRFHAARAFAKLKYFAPIALERATYPRAERLIIGSEIERPTVRRLGVEDAKIRLIPYGVDTARFFDGTGTRRRQVRARLGVPDAAWVALFVGRFVERKKPHVVARAFRMLAAEDPNFYGLMVGDGPMTEQVRNIVSGERRVQLLGAVPFDQLHEYYAGADVFTLPSVGEGSISLVVLEAAAAGLPLVLTDDSCGQSAVFEEGSNGEKVELGDDRSLADGLRRAFVHRAEYGARSRDLIISHFSWDKCARETVACYEEAMSDVDAT